MLCPTLTGCGDRFHLLDRAIGLESHVKDLVQTLVHEDVRDAILVGHSYGGTVITAAAASVPSRVRSLVYLDAQAPRDMETASGGLSEGSDERLAELTKGDGWLIEPLPLAAVGITKQEDVDWVEPRRHPHPMRTLLEPVHASPDALARMSRSYVRCSQREGLIGAFGVDPLQAFVERARSDGFRMMDIDAPHDAMVVAADLVSRALLAHA